MYGLFFIRGHILRCSCNNVFLSSSGGVEEDDDSDLDHLLHRFQRLRTENELCKPFTEQSVRYYCSCKLAYIDLRAMQRNDLESFA